jgi:hypothetical protein
MIRAKFTCQQNIPHDDGDGAYVSFYPVTSNPPTPENLSFWNATPSGQIAMSITNPNAVRQFEVGKDYYVDFIPVDSSEEVV